MIKKAIILAAGRGTRLEPLGWAGALRKIHQQVGFIDETVAVLSCDALVNLDLQAAAATQRARGALASVITREVAVHEAKPQLMETVRVAMWSAT